MSFDPADPVGSVFAEIIGKPAWQVRRGHAGMLTFEFGEPRLEVRDPMPSRAGNERVRALLARRRVTVAGAWHLWIHSCDWRVIENGTEVAHNEASDELIAHAASVLDSQVLLSVEVHPATAACRFAFDLGGILETSPYGGDSTDEQWLLFRPGGDVLTLRADSTWSLHAASVTPGGEVWHSLKR